jgi:hypothetical protein
LACIDDKEYTETILATIRIYSEAMRAERRESLDGAVLAALIAAWHRTRCADRVLLKSVMEDLKTDYPGLSPERLSKVIGKTLGFETRRVGGLSHIWNPAARLRMLAPRYALDPELPRWPVH